MLLYEEISAPFTNAIVSKKSDNDDMMIWYYITNYYTQQ